MATDSAGTLLRGLRRAALAQATAAPDAELLRRFLAERDEAAFEQLVRAHGPMVMGVCRRVLGDAHDAEDAFQAAFLILARKAGSIRDGAGISGWLYSVAYRTSLEARAMRSRRRRIETPAEGVPEPAGPPPPDTTELRALLDGELSALAEKYRSAIVLCDLEGRSRADAARELGIPEGTLSSRLAAGRARLAGRLRRRGLSLSVGTLAGLLTPAVTSAAVRFGLPAATAREATAFAFGSAGVASSRVVLIAKGVLKAMSLKKFAFGAALLLPLAAIPAVVIGPARAESSDSRPVLVALVGLAERPEGPKAAKEEAAEDGPSVQKARPVVVKTVPEAGGVDVDPGLDSIRVTFSKKMRDQSWSWAGADEGATPQVTGKPSYDKDGRTCVLPVKLEPGKTYAFWLNSQKFTNFKDVDGRSAVPYLLVFQTRKK